MAHAKRLARVHSVAFHGIAAQPVTVEANIGPGLPGMYVVGLADTSVRESKERIRTAVNNSAVTWPKSKIVISLSPASMPKAGSHFDLPITLAVLAAQAQDMEATARLKRTLVVGEVGLDGAIHPVGGVLAVLLAARDAGVDRVIIPEANREQAALAAMPHVHTVASLQQACGWLFSGLALPEVAGATIPEKQASTCGDFSDVAGQADAKFAAQVAAAGGHHLLMIGPPGSGKTMIARRLPGLLPPLTRQELMEVTTLHSLSDAGLKGTIQAHPFVAPHHSISRAALIGGGVIPKPGALSLAHCGVLFLDEVSEIPGRVLDGLRVPIEQKCVRLLRGNREYVFPARAQIVMAANPCRCAAEEPRDCTCTSQVRRTYLGNLSGPLKDRLDLVVRTHSQQAVLSDPDGMTTAQMAVNVCAARERAASRWRRHHVALDEQPMANAQVDSTMLRRNFPAEDSAMALIEAYLARGELSQRAVDRSLKIAWTLADLEGVDRPSMGHVVTALDMHADTFEAAAA